MTVCDLSRVEWRTFCCPRFGEASPGWPSPTPETHDAERLGQKAASGRLPGQSLGIAGKRTVQSNATNVTFGYTPRYCCLIICSLMKEGIGAEDETGNERLWRDLANKNETSRLGYSSTVPVAVLSRAPECSGAPHRFRNRKFASASTSHCYKRPVSATH